MGNLASKFFGEKDIDFNDDRELFNFLNKYSKSEILRYIRFLKINSLNLDDDFTEKLKDIELENTQLIPMSIEFYKKALRKVGVFNKIPMSEKEKLTKKKIYFVKPKFEIDQVKESLDNQNHDFVAINTNLQLIRESIVAMKMENINIDEYNASFNNVLLKRDMLGINKKMLRDMPKYLKLRFINCYNRLLNEVSKVPNLSIGRASYIYKINKHGPTNDIKSFRQVVTIPNVVNQFHRILSLRLSNYLLLNKYIDTTIQKGGIMGQKFAIFEQFYKIKNILKIANAKKKSVAVLFLDISNAFGNLNLQNLYQILKVYRVDNNFIKYLQTFYNNFEYYIPYPNDKNQENLENESFKWKNGLIQGCSLSPLLFVLALNYVLKSIDDSYKQNFGFDIDGVNKILLTAFVDDICIITKDVISLEFIYDKLEELLKPLGLPINKDKCAIMVNNDNYNVAGSLSAIQKVNVFKYLGEYLASDGSSTESYVQFLKHVTRRLLVLDSKNYTNDQKMYIFNAMILPWIQRKTMAMYDLERTRRLKIVSILKSYLEKWSNDVNVDIFTNINQVLSVSDDTVINNVKFSNEDIDHELEQDIDIANFVMKDSHIRIEYSQIDNDFELDMQLENYDEIIDCDESDFQ